MSEMINRLAETIGAGLPNEVILWFPSVLVFLLAATAFYLIARALSRKPSREEVRVRELRPDELEAEPSEGGLFAAVAPALAVQIPETEKERHDFRLILRQAGMYDPRARTTIYAVRFLLLIVPLIAAGVWVVLANNPHATWKILGGGLFLGITLSITPRLYVWLRRRRRLRRIRAGLPDTIDMLSMCSSGGMGLSESLQHVAGQLAAYPEVAQELLILRRQAEVSSLKQALADFAQRVDLPEARQLAALLTRGTRLGTQLAGSLNEQADHLRTARRQAATTAANKTPVKLVFPILFCMAPAALLLLLAPAMFDLHDFLFPKPGHQITSSPGAGFGTGAIFSTMDKLDQHLDPKVIGDALAPGPQPVTY